jgi:pimeloyl-ACP methyl ester carboxylesterase
VRRRRVGVVAGIITERRHGYRSQLRCFLLRCVDSRRYVSAVPYARAVTTFALVHGSWHGAWCWERQAPLLERAGHDVIAMDLPIDDPTTTCDDYADVVCAALDGCGKDVVVVGHSFGGMVLPLVAARRPVRHLVYVCAYAPEIGRSLNDQLSDDPESFNPAAYEGFRRDAQGRSVWFDNTVAREMMYADCDDSIVEAAINRLRPHSTYPNKLVCSLTEFPSVPCTAVICTDDRLIRRTFAKRIADRLGANVIELPGSHSPFYSRPQELAEVLLRIVD